MLYYTKAIFLILFSHVMSFHIAKVKIFSRDIYIVLLMIKVV